MDGGIYVMECVICNMLHLVRLYAEIFKINIGEGRSLKGEWRTYSKTDCVSPCQSLRRV
jgi:hypothetical protein